MSSALAPSAVGLPGECADGDAPPDGGSRTLEQRLEAIWHDVRVDGAAECPACHGAMSRHGDAGVCSDCGSSLC